ncbi:ankyrin repeat-containing domain protein [Halenospora varia]|nr:ankyrin repeat-containing domain protein [Halenospora varia]
MATIDNGKAISTETKRKDSSAQRQSDDEDWTKLTDISSRRRIQNRIAQRNRRKKLKESRERSKTPEPGSHSRGGSIGGSKSPDLRPQSEQNGPKFVIDTPYLSQNGSNSNRPLIFLDSMSTTDTKALMTQLEQAQSQLQEFMAGKQSVQQLPTPPRTSQDIGATASVDWDPSWLSTFDNDDMTLLGQDLDSLSAMPGLMGPGSDRFCLDPSLQDDEPSTTRSTINVLPQTTNADSLYLTPPTTSVPFPMQRASSAPAIPHFSTSSDFLPTPPLPQPTRSRSHSNVSDMSTSSSNHDASSHGNTALHLATLKGHLPIIRLLLQTSSPSQLNTANLSGQTPLHLAIITKNQPVAHFLISQHADTSALTHNNESILHLAVESGSTEMVELCLDLAGELRDKRDSEGRTAFHRAVAGGNEGIVRLLLQRGVNHQAKVGDQTPTLGDDFTFDWGMIGH